jgi:hypothetical protein
MPVLIPAALLDAWLAGPPPDLTGFAPGDLVPRPVSARVNSVENDDPACLKEAEAEKQGQLL